MVMLLSGDCRDAMEFNIASNSVDSIVTDPPYGLEFMGKEWDRGVPGVEFWRHALDVLKPGGHLLAFSGTRTYHRMVCAIEDAGFEIRDQIGWVYGSGFPKSMDVSKAIDKEAGAERTVRTAPKAGHEDFVGRDNMKALRESGALSGDGGFSRPWMHDPQKVEDAHWDFAPATEAAAQWQGWGTALKPAWEPIVVARKPLAKGCTVAANVLTHGTGALNIDACRVEVTDTAYARNCSGDRGHAGTRGVDEEGATNLHVGGGRAASGRWPANLIHDGSDEVLAAFPAAPGQLAKASTSDTQRAGQNVYGAMVRGSNGQAPRDDAGSAARFFYCAKASKSDRGTDNTHPTVKPTELMRYLCRLVTPPGGLVLDPFMGSGSTGKAAVLEGFRFVGIDLNPEYVEIARARIAGASAQ